MRYREEGLPVAENLATTDDMYLFTVVLGLVIGVILTWMGLVGRQVWLTVWSIGLMGASVTYIGWAVTRT